MIILALLLAGCAIQQQAMPGPEEQDIELEVEEEPEQEKEVDTEPEPAPAEPETEPAPALPEDTCYNYESLSNDQQRKIKLVRNLLEEA